MEKKINSLFFLLYVKGGTVKKITIHAVHDRNISKFWDSLELPESQPCFICGKKVTKENVGAFAPIDGKVEVVCEKLRCFYELNNRKRRNP